MDFCFIHTTKREWPFTKYFNLETVWTKNSSKRLLHTWHLQGRLRYFVSILWRKRITELILKSPTLCTGIQCPVMLNHFKCSLLLPQCLWSIATGRRERRGRQQTVSRKSLLQLVRQVRYSPSSRVLHASRGRSQELHPTGLSGHSISLQCAR